MLKTTRILVVLAAMTSASFAQTPSVEAPPATPPAAVAPASTAPEATAPTPAAPAPAAQAPAPAAPAPAAPAPAAPAAPAPAAQAPAAQVPAPVAPQRLTGAAAIAAIAGNTLSGKIDGSDNVMFFSSDGRLTMLVDAEQTQGKWELRGREVCVIVEDEDDDCYELEVTGEMATLKEDATTAYRMSITKGNAKNLPLARR